MNVNGLFIEWSYIPGGPVVKTPCFHCQGQEKKNLNGTSPVVQWLMQTCQCRSRKIPHASGQLSPRATMTEPAAPQSPRSATREAIAMRSPHSPHLKKVRANNEDPAQPKIN